MYSTNQDNSNFYDDIHRLIVLCESMLESYIMPQAIYSLLQYMISVLKIFQSTGLTSEVSNDQ